ncbi:hypothetical protein HU200_022848 [Digitaria exilis]|uniref:Protein DETOXIFICATION n=1 Tax=Digitaria exilis TaxID=1010633 RepID=A0A835EX60_9POAL|nr:hypothetical protein HU200_022848 [Digitaria exilis]
METPLLTLTASRKKSGEGESRVVCSEVKRQVYLAGPLVAGLLLQNIVQMISIMFVGHLGKLPLAGASVASSFATVTGFSVLSGMASSLETLCGQAFGAGQHHLLGVYKQRAMLVLSLVSVPAAAVWAYTGEILAWCGLDLEIAAAAGSYIRWLIPALFVYGPLQCHVRFLQTQNVVVPVMLSSAATAVSHVAVCWLLVHRLGLGSNGAALGTAVSYLINLSILALYVRLSTSCKNTWLGFSREAFHGIGDFLKLAVPSALMVCMVWWSFEILVLLSGLLPNPQLETAVFSISMNIAFMAFTVPLGLSAAISTRVSNELGAGRPEAARLATQVTMVVAFLVCATEGLVVLLLRNIWGLAYSSNEEVTKYTAVITPTLAVAMFLDGLQGVLSGVIRGCGQQKIGAFISIASYYLVGIPSAFFFAFVCHLGGKGLWFGQMCGMVVQMFLLFTITLCTNWDKEVRVC